MGVTRFGVRRAVIAPNPAQPSSGAAWRDAEPAYARMTPEQVLARIVQLEKRMYQHARDLEFEQAARLRDEIAELQQGAIGFPKRAQSG